ncbi:hypothetical protein [Adlercreutzia murintestinalis]|uniref:hypothetical protein n=1 Tax=Adlercreutzia murintestinalis TaxID=2941325 RepID=UPI002042100C|nr:hypothetical protein [Adlercreutzia murintestinalis]
MTRVHFGIATRLPLRDLRLSKRNLIYRTGRGRYLFKDAWLRADRRLWAEHRRRCLLNYDLSMAYFRQLSPEAFDAAIEHVRASFPQLEAVEDLRTLEGVQGVYLMVLDKHRQAYVGKACGKHGIKHRIVRHWRNAVPFDRLLSGEPEESILPIDAFRMLDTTRIFACAADEVRAGELERALVDAMPLAFSLNRTKGGALAGGLHEAIQHRRTRDLRIVGEK